MKTKYEIVNNKLFQFTITPDGEKHDKQLIAVIPEGCVIDPNLLCEFIFRANDCDELRDYFRNAEAEKEAAKNKPKFDENMIDKIKDVINSVIGLCKSAKDNADMAASYASDAKDQASSAESCASDAKVHADYAYDRANDAVEDADSAIEKCENLLKLVGDGE